MPADADAQNLIVPPDELGAAVEESAARLGIEELYPEQVQTIGEALAGRNVLMILPTGFGKSACYQVPSMLSRKPVVVISPLLALLRDQQVKLEKRGIPVLRLDGTVRGRARKEAFERIGTGEPVLVMTTPETLENAAVSELLGRTGIGLAAVDEAHCVSEWGHDFRPSYSRIGRRLRELGSPPVMALTATATPRVRETIVQSLGMGDPTVVAASPHRSNLAFEVICCEGDQRPRAMLRLTKRLRRPGIIYCATRREVEALWILMKRFKVPAYRYHGGMTATERNEEQHRFMRPRRRAVMVATNAFGLGIDKRNIRFILHYQAPSCLENYLQEAGRAGRDGRKANCLLLQDPTDRSIHEALQARSRVRPDQLYKLGRALSAWAAEGREPTLQALAVSAELGPRIVAALLTRMEEGGLVRRDEKIIRIDVPADEIEERARGLAGQFETLRTQDSRRLDALGEYARTEGCRAVFLRAYFGEEEAEDCGLCDNCQEKPDRAAGFFAPIAAPEPPARKKKTAARKGQKKRPRRGRPQRGRRGAQGAQGGQQQGQGQSGQTADGQTAKTGQEQQGNKKPRRRRSRRRRPRRRSGGSESDSGGSQS